MNQWNDMILKPEHMAQQQQQTQQHQLIYSNQMNDQPQSAAAAAAAVAMMMSHPNLDNSLLDNENGENDDSMDNSDDDCNSSVNDAEGVWSPDIEQSFQEALAIYPPCGRRKIILSEEGKMYGRNELIARYIKVRTGKTRSRKQVSSHIQVLAKRKTKDFHNHIKDTKDVKFSSGSFQNPFSNLTSAQIISPQPILPIQNQQQNLVVPSPTTLLANNTKLNQNTQPNTNSNPPQPTPQNTQQLNRTSSQNVINPQIAQQRAQPVHHPHLLQNCTNLIQTNQMNPSQTNSIWSHPGIQQQQMQHAEKTHVPHLNDDLLQNTNNENRHHTHHHLHHHHHLSTINPHNLHQSNQQLSPDSSPNSNQQQLWSLYTNNSTNTTTTTNNSNQCFNKSVIGLSHLKLIEFSGFLEKRRDLEIYHKHLFLHLNTHDYFSDGLNEEFESINYKEFGDKFPESDLMWSLQNQEKTSICSSYLVKYWVDLNYIIEEGVSAIYAVTNIFESPEPMTISCSTKVCSFGNQVVEKVENEHAQYESGRYVYRFENSPMCEYMITFINKLKQLPEKNLKNNVLENFSVLQIIKNNDTKEILLTLAYVFEVSTSEHGAQHVIYRLTNT
ncbi:unnamed protein product [Brachionus calyciflorus]|uniref:TEA domain-containing protein n=1 Tax=Brachionus calyciflorus TaxID=104777 RepID=A0A813WAX7_9BILA|nr:unnamed protein product [Brachionus calyciflorus]